MNNSVNCPGVSDALDDLRRQEVSLMTAINVMDEMWQSQLNRACPSRIGLSKKEESIRITINSRFQKPMDDLYIDLEGIQRQIQLTLGQDSAV
jgi:cell division protein ZapA (FtsZ GTPase activity inhibitor)